MTEDWIEEATSFYQTEIIRFFRENPEDIQQKLIKHCGYDRLFQPIDDGWRTSLRSISVDFLIYHFICQMKKHVEYLQSEEFRGKQNEEEK